MAHCENWWGGDPERLCDRWKRLLNQYQRVAKDRLCEGVSQHRDLRHLGPMLASAAYGFRDARSGPDTPGNAPSVPILGHLLASRACLPLHRIDRFGHVGLTNNTASLACDELGDPGRRTAHCSGSPDDANTSQTLSHYCHCTSLGAVFVRTKTGFICMAMHPFPLNIRQNFKQTT